MKWQTFWAWQCSAGGFLGSTPVVCQEHRRISGELTNGMLWTKPQGGCTLRLLRIFFSLLTVSFPFGRLLLSPPVLDVVSLGRPLPPRLLVAHKGLVASPHMGHGTADVGIHDDADGDIGKWSGWSRSEDSCRTLPIYIWNYSICNFGDYSWNRLFKNPL